MEQPKIASLFPGMTPDQTKHFMQLDAQMRVLIPAIIKTFADRRFLNTSILAALATAAAQVIKSSPPEHQKNLFDAHVLVIRDAAFNTLTVVDSIPAPDLKPK